MRCPNCNQKLATAAKFCHQCGAKLPPEVVRKTENWYYEPLFVILMIFLFLAVFGLPLLWKSPRFATWQKSIISVITVIYTGAILWLTYYLAFVLFLPYYKQVMAAGL